MSLLFYDGVGHSDTASVTQKYAARGSSMTISAGQYTFPVMGLAADTFLTTVALSPTTQTGYMGFRRQVSGGELPRSGFSVWLEIQVIDASGLPLITVTSDADSLPSIRRGDEFGTVLGSSATPLFVNSTTVTVELAFTIDGTNGSAELRVDNVPLITVSGVNTKPNGLWSAVTFWPRNGNNFYILDSSGSRLNFFLGKDTRVLTLFPNANGTYTQMTSTGGQNYSCVDESAPNGNTDYVTGQLAGTRDSYAMQDLGTSSYNSVHAVQANHSVETVSGAKTLTPGLVIGGAWYGGTTRPAPFAYSDERQIWALNPATGQLWTETDINALEVGLEVTA